MSKKKKKKHEIGQVEAHVGTLVGPNGSIHAEVTEAKV